MSSSLATSALLVEVLDAGPAEPTQATLPAELVPIFCAGANRPSLVVTISALSVDCSWHIAVDGAGTRIADVGENGATREFVTATSLLTLALAEWLDLADRGPAPRSAKVTDRQAFLRREALDADLEDLVVTITRPETAAVTVIAKALPSGYYIGVAIEEDATLLLMPATGSDVWLCLNSLLAED